jgi:hypothetical protein
MKFVSVGSLIFFLPCSEEGVDLVVRKVIPLSWMSYVGLMHCCVVWRNNLLTMLLVFASYEMNIAKKHQVHLFNLLHKYLPVTQMIA